MGLLDLAESFLGGGQDGGDLRAKLLQAAAGLIQNQPGGLQDLLGRFADAGLGQQATSWVSTGANLPIDPGQVTQALGAEQVEAIAQQAGVPAEHASSGLAALLPSLIDQLTPDGQVPGAGTLQQGLAGLLGKFLG